eukprot:SAG22_NODE_1312_length_4776_cov_2.886466_6_plen_75_part_00
MLPLSFYLRQCLSVRCRCHRERSGTPSTAQAARLRQQLAAAGVRPDSGSWLAGLWKSMPLTYELQYLFIVAGLY